MENKIVLFFKSNATLILSVVSVMAWFDQRYLTAIEKVGDKMEAYHIEAMESKGNVIRLEANLQALKEEVRSKEQEKERAPVDGTRHTTSMLFVPPIKDDDKDKQICYISAQ